VVPTKPEDSPSGPNHDPTIPKAIPRAIPNSPTTNLLASRSPPLPMMLHLPAVAEAGSRRPRSAPRTQDRLYRLPPGRRIAPAGPTGQAGGVIPMAPATTATPPSPGPSPGPSPIAPPPTSAPEATPRDRICEAGHAIAGAVAGRSTGHRAQAHRPSPISCWHLTHPLSLRILDKTRKGVTPKALSRLRHLPHRWCIAPPARRRKGGPVRGPAAIGPARARPGAPPYARPGWGRRPRSVPRT